MDGIVTDIQSFSLHDGPGIRTTVFCKGCPLRCAWCHNPETLSAQVQFFHYAERCTFCGQCAVQCPQNALSLADDGRLSRSKSCNACGMCERTCVNDAIKQSGRRVSAEWVIAEATRDKAFFDQSGGGVTLSGGEVMCQTAFAVEILAGCKARGIHTCIESSLSLPFDHCRPVLDHCDMVIMDIKLWDSGKHKQWTGAGNEQILANFERLAALDIPVVIRTPIVAGVNDDEAEISAIARFIARANNVQAYELLTYHDLGADKRVALGMDGGIAFPPVNAEKMAVLRGIAAMIR